jgi:hypothetical protein
MMAFTIDPPGPFDPKRVWLRYLDQLKSLPQDDPKVQAAIKDAEYFVKRAKN